MKQSGAHPREVKGMGISGQMHGLVMLDEFGDIIRPSIIWCGQTTGGKWNMIQEFVPITRAILVLSGLTIIRFGPRPLNFLVCNAPVKQLYNLGVD